MLNKYSTYFKWINIVIDYLILNFSILLALHLEGSFVLGDEITEVYKLDILLLNLFWFYCAKLVGLYNNVLKRDAGPTIKHTVYALIFYFLVANILNATFDFLNFSFKFLIICQTSVSLLIFTWKFYFLALRRAKRKFWVEYTRIVVLGAGKAGVELSNYFNDNPQLGIKVEGIFDDNTLLPVKNHSLLGKIEDCFDYIKSAGISEIYCALPNNQISKIKGLIQEADRQMVRFRIVPDINELLEQNVITPTNGRFPLLSFRTEPLENKVNEICKRLFDIVFSFLVIVFLLSWLIPIVGIIIKWNSKGPVFFKQLRSGKDNKPFYCFKFRTMCVNADSDNKQSFKGDMRVTSVGAFLRKTSLDELPQFINVLLGDMSVVGPRPHMLKHTEDYSALIDSYMVRQFLTPGITGWAQVNGFRGETKETEAMSKRIEADLWYLENWSFLLDIKIVLLTVWQTIKGQENAY